MNHASHQTPPVSAYCNQSRAIAKREQQTSSVLPRLLLSGLVGLIALFFLTMTVKAEETTAPSVVPVETIEAMQMVIRGQIDAFQADDAETAFGYAAPGIQERFSSPARFAAMVRRGYSTVFEHQSYSFIDEALTPEGPAQRVEFVSEDGQVWGGIYTFEEAEDGKLFISGVFLRRENATQI